MMNLDDVERKEFTLNNLPQSLAGSIRVILENDEGRPQEATLEEKKTAIYAWLSDMTERRGQLCAGCHLSLQIGVPTRTGLQPQRLVQEDGRRNRQIVLFHKRCEEAAMEQEVIPLTLDELKALPAFQLGIAQIIIDHRRAEKKKREIEAEKRRNGHSSNGNSRKSEATSRVSRRVQYAY